MSDFEATEMQFKPEPVEDLFKNAVSFALGQSLTVLIDLSTPLRCQKNCIKFKVV